MNGLYGVAVSTLKVLGVLALAGSVAGGFVAFGRWRTSLRNRLIGIEPPRHEGELMQLDVLRELQRRGRFFYEMFPGVKASDAWQRQRDQHEQGEITLRRSRPEMTVHKDLAPKLQLRSSADVRIREFLR